METMKAFWRYDWALNRARLITMIMIAALQPWVVALSREGLKAGASWAVFATVFSGLSVLVVPGILLGYTGDLGRTGAPPDFRHFNRVLPIDHGRWAHAKVVSVLSWGVTAPALLFVLSTVATVLAFGEIGKLGTPDLIRLLLSGLLFLSVASAGALWSLLGAALMPRGQSSGAGGLLGAAVFVGGELLVRGVTGFRDLGEALKRVRALWESASEIGLCLLLVGVLAVVFVRYHKDRRVLQAVGLALVALIAIDGARAWLWR